MDAHRKYCGPSPTHLFRILLENRHQYGNLEEDSNWSHLLNDTAALLNTILGVWLSQWTPEELDRTVSHKSMADLLRTIYETEAERNGKVRLFVKENHTYEHIPFLESAFPNSKYVFVVRDPRDMALSWKKSPNLRGSVIRASRVWNTDQKACLKLYSSLRDFSRIFLLRYEDLLVQPEKQLRQLCDFLQVEFDSTILDFSGIHLTQKNAGCSADWRNLEKPLIRKNFNKYKSELSEEEIRYIEATNREEMDLLGYERDYQISTKLSELEKAILPDEKHEKPEYLRQPDSQRIVRQRRQDVIDRIRARLKIPVCKTSECPVSS